MERATSHAVTEMEPVLCEPRTLLELALATVDTPHWPSSGEGQRLRAVELHNPRVLGKLAQCLKSTLKLAANRRGLVDTTGWSLGGSKLSTPGDDFHSVRASPVEFARMFSVYACRWLACTGCGCASG